MFVSASLLNFYILLQNIFTVIYVKDRRMLASYASSYVITKYCVTGRDSPQAFPVCPILSIQKPKWRNRKKFEMSWRFVLSGSTRISTCVPPLAVKRNFATRSEAKSAGESHLLQRLFQGIIRGDRGSLAQAITLVETLHPSKYHQAQKLLARVVKYSKHAAPFSNGRHCSFRIGLSGPPGGGKSTFIETFGTFLTNRKHQVAVLAVDPSSSTTGGSLLGDKTRMTELSRNPHAYIRPSPSSGTLGNKLLS